MKEESEAMRALYPSLTRKMSRMKPKLEKRRRNVLVRFRHAYTPGEMGVGVQGGGGVWWGLEFAVRSFELGFTDDGAGVGGERVRPG